MLLIYISLFIGIIVVFSFFSILFVLLCVDLATLNLLIKIDDNLSLMFIKLY